MICGVNIGGKDTLEEWGLMLCNDLSIGAAVPRYRFIEIPEMSGALDLTEALTGSVPYDQRTITFTLFAVHDVIAGTRSPASEEHFQTVLARFSGFANGKRLHLYLPDNPDHYFVGRVSVGGKSGYNSGRVKVEVLADPYRLKDGETTLTVDDDDFFKTATPGTLVTFDDGGENLPMTSVEVSLSPRQLWPPTASNPSPIKGWNSASLYVSASQTPKHYTMRWDKIAAKGIRLNDAAGITTTTTNFGHFGSVNANYNNPFDSIYPWSGRKLCNIDLDAYMALASSNKITDCVTAWEGDTSFSYTDPYGVWVYTPEFWGKSWDDGTYRYFDVTDMENNSYVHYPEMITGRWHGVEHTLTINGASKVCFLPTVGINASNKAVSTYHTEAKNYGGTLTDIYTLDASTLLMVVEFASLNSQTAVGNGVSNLYRQSSDMFTSASSGAVVYVTKANAGAVIPGAIFDIGTSNGGIQIGRYYVVSTATNSSDSTILDVTLNESVTVTTSNMWSVHGLINVADEEIGSKSGYIGTNGQHNAYYRGEVLWANKWQYILGAYRQTGTGKIWICPADLDPDNYDALNTSVHDDTGILLPASASGFIQTLAMWDELAVPAFATTIGGNANNPVGDFLYTPAATAGNTVLLVGGDATGYSGAGVFCGVWSAGGGASSWYISARPHLKNPS